MGDWHGCCVIVMSAAALWYMPPFIPLQATAMFYVAYSSHSSFSELEAFLTAVAPCEVRAPHYRCSEPHVKWAPLITVVWNRHIRDCSVVSSVSSVSTRNDCQSCPIWHTIPPMRLRHVAVATAIHSVYPSIQVLCMAGGAEY